MESNIDILLKIINKISAIKNPDDKEVSKILVQNPSLNGKTFLKSDLIFAYSALKANKTISFSQILEKKVLESLKMKKVRSLSGVTPVSVLTKPFPCPGKCIYCPNDLKMPKSYLSSEPGAQRAFSNKFDPYLQVFNRLVAYRNIGHPTDKVELIVLGGTWSFYTKNYQIWFIDQCFKAMNDFDRKNSNYLSKVTKESKRGFEQLIETQKENEKANSRCVGLVLETRPDFITKDEVIRLRKLGATKIQIGVQSLSENILRLNKRGHGLKAISMAFKLLRQAGFKIQVHWMPNLLGSDVKKDIADFKKIFTDKRFRPDEIKIYPCSLIKGTELFKFYSDGKWRPYSNRELVDLLEECVLATPRYCRISRMIRDISAADIVVGNKKSNLRQIVESKLQKEGKKINEIRFREIRNENFIASRVTLKVTSYNTTSSEELFLECITRDDKIVGFLRLSLPKIKPFIDELKNSAVIREIHVYGETLEIGKTADGKAQHVGIGRNLIKESKRIAFDRGFKKISVISSVGTREYYRKNGFLDGNLYQYQQI